MKSKTSQIRIFMKVVFTGLFLLIFASNSILFAGASTSHQVTASVTPTLSGPPLFTCQNLPGTTCVISDDGNTIRYNMNYSSYPAPDEIRYVLGEWPLGQRTDVYNVPIYVSYSINWHFALNQYSYQHPTPDQTVFGLRYPDGGSGDFVNQWNDHQGTFHFEEYDIIRYFNGQRIDMFMGGYSSVGETVTFDGWIQLSSYPNTALLIISADPYICDPAELNPIALAVFDSLDDQNQNYCKNTFGELLAIPNVPLNSITPEEEKYYAFTKFKDLIVDAHYEVDFSTMIWKDSAEANEILDGVVELYGLVDINENGKYSQGVTVRFLLGSTYMYDPWDQRKKIWDKLLEKLLERGFDIYNLNPNFKLETGVYRESKLERFGDFIPPSIHGHVKMLVVDGRELIVAGYNVDPGYDSSGKPTTDMGLRVSGPIAQDALQTFDKLWAQARLCTSWIADLCTDLTTAPSENDIIHLPEVEEFVSYPAEGVNIFSLYRDDDEKEADNAVKAALRAATNNVRILQNRYFEGTPHVAGETIWISNPEFSNNDTMEYTMGILDALEDGVSVTMIVSGTDSVLRSEKQLSTDSVVNLLILAKQRNISLQPGQIFCVKMTPTYLHAKALSMDDNFLIVGSQNFDFSSYGDYAGIDLAEYSLGIQDDRVGGAVSDFNTRFAAEYARSGNMYPKHGGWDAAWDNLLNCDGEPQPSFSSTIQDLIDQAEPGSYIALPPGNYTETLVINKPLTLYSLQPDVTTIEPPAGSPAIRITSDGVAIDNFTIRGAEGYGVEIQNSSSNDFENIRVGSIIFENNDSGGVLFSGTGGIQYTLENNTFIGGESGITIDTSNSAPSPSLVRNNLLVGQTIAPILVTSSNDGGVEYRYNLFTQCPLNDCDSTWISGNMSSASDEHDNLFDLDPEFVDAGNGDFTLESDSPILEAGETYGMVGEYVLPYTFIGALPNDTMPPMVISSIRASADPTSMPTVDFTVTFSESVTGVDISDFTLTTAGLTEAGVNTVTGSGATYTVTVNTGTGNGTIRLNVVDNDTILDASSNPLDGGFTAGESYTINKAPLSWNTFLGGSGNDSSRTIVQDADGNTYVSGVSNMSWGTPIQVYAGGELNGDDVYVAKLDPSGNLLWNTFLGSANVEIEGHGLAVDENGNVYVTGGADGSWGIPVHPFGGLRDTFVAKLDSDGVLLWHTYLGGVDGVDAGQGITVHDGTIYMTGTSDAAWGWGVPLAAYSSGVDGFLASLNATNGSLNWHTFFGGSGADIAHGIEKDAAGNLYVSGYAGETWGNPVRAHVPGGDNDGMMVKFNSSGVLLWNTFLGGSGFDIVNNLDIGSTGDLYLAGRSVVGWGDPLSAYAGGSQDGFVAKLDPTTGALLWHSFIGGNGADYAWGVEVDESDNINIVGSSDTGWGSPLTAFSSGYDGFYAKFTPSGGLLLNTFIGGGGADRAYSLDLDNENKVYITGYSNDSWGNPVRPYSAGNDGFVTKVAVDSPPLIVSSVTRNAASPSNASSVSYTVTFSEPVTGVDASDFALTTTGITGASIDNVSGSGSTYTVTVNTGTGNGAIRLDVLDDDTILNSVSNDLAAGFTLGQSYDVIDNTAPTVLSSVINSTISAASTISFTVNFSEAVSGVDLTDFNLTTTDVTGAYLAGVSGSGDTYVVSVNNGIGGGTIHLNVLDDDSIVDVDANRLGGTGTGNGEFTGGESYTIESLTINSAAVQDGWVLESTQNSNVGGTSNNTATTFRAGDDDTNKQYRNILHFSTAVLPDTAVITSVTLKIKQSATVTGTNPFTTHGNLLVDIKKPYFGSAAALAPEDFESAAGLAGAGTFNSTPVSNWYTAVLNMAGFPRVSLTGNTQVRVLFTLDDNNDSSADYMSFFSSDHATEANHPDLIIQYFVP
jgi:hypothetical protein